MEIVVLVAIGAFLLYEIYHLSYEAPASTETPSAGPINQSSVSSFINNAFGDLSSIVGDFMKPPAPTQGIDRFSSAIAQAEGFYTPGSIPQRAHNPGDLTQGDFGDTGQYLTAAGGEQIIVFPNDEAGWNALYAKLLNILNGNSRVYRTDMTIYEMASIWTASDISQWAANVANYLGVSPTYQIGGLLA
jgi:hypothetical protein